MQTANPNVKVRSCEGSLILSYGSELVIGAVEYFDMLVDEGKITTDAEWREIEAFGDARYARIAAYAATGTLADFSGLPPGMEVEVNGQWKSDTLPVYLSFKTAAWREQNPRLRSAIEKLRNSSGIETGVHGHLMVDRRLNYHPHPTRGTDLGELQEANLKFGSSGVIELLSVRTRPGLVPLVEDFEARTVWRRFRTPSQVLVFSEDATEDTFLILGRLGVRD